MREIKKIAIHCSASKWGSAEAIDMWHKDRGWSGIGYHFVIPNGKLHSYSDYDADSDGLIQYGRPEDKTGAHVKGHNSDSLGICLIGVNLFTTKQLETALELVKGLMEKYDVPLEKVLGHNEFPDVNKACPGFDMKIFRKMLIGVSFNEVIRNFVDGAEI